MENEHGIESIETVIGALCGVGVDIEAALADGKFNIPSDLFRFVDDLLKIPAVMKALPNVDEEFIDLTDEESEKLVEEVKTKLNLPSADVTEVVASAMDALLSTSETIRKVMVLVENIKELKHPKA